MGELTDLVAASFDAFGRKVARLEAERDALAAELAAHKETWELAKPNLDLLAAVQTRNAALEAALREIADFAEQFIADDEDGDERMYKVHQIADNAIPFTAETEAKHEG